MTGWALIRRGAFALVAVLLVASSAVFASAEGGIRELATLGETEYPEGLSVAPDGQVYFGADPGRLLRVGLDGKVHDVGNIPLSDDDFLLGVAEHAGSLYVIARSGEDQRGSLWVVNADGGEPHKVADFPEGAGPNDLVFGRAGRIFVTDSLRGSVLRLQLFGSIDTWAQDPLLLGNAEDPGPIGNPTGANGIAQAPAGDAFYVSVTDSGRVVRIPIEDGRAGEIEVVAEGAELVGADGMAFGPDGRLYVAVNVQDQIVAVDVNTGAFEVVLEGEPLRFPAVLRFSPDFRTLYVTNSDLGVLFGLRPGPAKPGLLAIDSELLVGTPAGIKPPSTGSGGLLAE